MASVDLVSCVPVPPVADAPFLDCALCSVREAARCALLPPNGTGGHAEIEGTKISVRARRAIGDPSGADPARVTVVCSGLAFRSRVMRSGRRQILNYLMPGDLVSAHDIFGDERAGDSHAVTDVRCMSFGREQLLDHLAEHPELMRRIARGCASEAEQIEELLIDLGRCTGMERVARFFVGYARRIFARGWDRLRPIPFPIRQAHLADTLGLTTTHVGRIIGQLRGERVVEIGKGWMTLLDIRRLAQFADLRLDEWASPRGHYTKLVRKGKPS